MGVQKHLFVIERGVRKELLKLKTNARSFTKSFFVAKYVETIMYIGRIFEAIFNCI